MTGLGDYFDRFDLCEGAAVFAEHYGAYALFDRLTHGLRFKPRPSLNLNTLTDNARAVYDALAERYGDRFDVQTFDRIGGAA